MNIILNLLLIAFICVFCIDYSGFIEEADRLITKALKSKVPLHIPKPFSCSLCSTWWVGIIYLAIVGNLNLPYIAALAGVSFLTPEILSIIYFIKDAINKLFITIENFLRIN